MTAYLGQGATVTFGGIAIAQLLSIDGPNIERTMVDTTNLGTTTLRTFVPGFGDGGEVSLECQFEHATGQEDVFESIDAGSSTAVAVVITTDNERGLLFAENQRQRQVVGRQRLVLITVGLVHAAQFEVAPGGFWVDFGRFE